MKRVDLSYALLSNFLKAGCKWPHLTFFSSIIERYVIDDKLLEIFGGKCVATDVSTASATIIKANDTKGVVMTSA